MELLVSSLLVFLSGSFCSILFLFT